MKFIFLLIATTFALHSTKHLEIHIFDVGQGDAQLVVFPSGYSIMIDCGDRDKEKGTTTKHIAKRIETILGKKKVDVLVLSHFHADHFGKYGRSGIWYLIEKAGISFGKFIKRDIGKYTGSKLADCSKSTMSWKYVGTMSSEIAKFVCYATSQKEKTKLSKIAVTAKRCDPTQIDPPDSGAKVTILIKDALGIQDTKYDKPVARNSINDGKKKISENDFSICMKIEYKKFIYATCGDLSGVNMPTSEKKFNNIEKHVASMMGEVDLYKVNHHGSSTATNEKWANTLKPTVSVVTCGGGSLPSKEPLQYLKNVGSKIYTTGDDCEQKYIDRVGGVTEMGEDIIIKVPSSGSTFTIATASGKKSKSFTIKSNKKTGTCKKL